MPVYGNELLRCLFSREKSSLTSSDRDLTHVRSVVRAGKYIFIRDNDLLSQHLISGMMRVSIGKEEDENAEEEGN